MLYHDGRGLTWMGMSNTISVPSCTTPGARHAAFNPTMSIATWKLAEILLDLPP